MFEILHIIVKFAQIPVEGECFNPKGDIKPYIKNIKIFRNYEQNRPR